MSFSLPKRRLQIWRRAAVLFAAFGLLDAARAETASNWHPATWNGEKAWEATSAGWTATVSEARGRLVSLTPAGGHDNLLYAPPKGAISWGGHRCWLGPQEEWKTIWPPPRDWEASAAEAVKAAGPVLTVVLPHTDPGYPALTRQYEWQGGVLHSRLAWEGAQYHAIQILQLPRWAIVHAQRPAPAQPEIPLGYARMPVGGRTGMEVGKPLAEGVGRIERREVTLWHANTTEKLAFAPQELRAEVGAWQIKVGRGKDQGVTASTPNLGLLTQVYLGDWENPFIELEQFSAFGVEGLSSSEILIEPSKPESKH